VHDTQTKDAASKAPCRGLVLIDAANFLYRAFFAIPPLHNAEGLPTNAVYGFAQMLAKVIREERPEYLVVAMDARGESFRRELYPEYKAHREAQPEDLSAQIPLMRELCEAYGVSVVEREGFEADDVIATLVAAAPPDLAVRIVSTDKDLMQLVNERVELLDTMKDRRYGPAEVTERFGVPPERVLDWRSLVGDPSDNIPGVRGIGEKGAAQLIQTWGSLENLLAHSDEITAARARAALQKQREQAVLSKRLLRLHSDVPLAVKLSDCRFQPPSCERLRALFQRLGFARLLAALDAQTAGAPSRAAEAELDAQKTAALSAISDGGRIHVDVICDEESLLALLRELAVSKELVLTLVASGESVMRSENAGVVFALSDARAAYVPFGHRDRPLGAPAAARVAAALVELCGAGRGWITRDAKRLHVFLEEQGYEVPTARCDLEIAACLLDPAAPRSTVALAARWLELTLQPWEALAGRGAKARSATELAVGETALWAAEEVCGLRSLYPVLSEALQRDGLLRLLDEVEMPLTRVLARMERCGVRIDEDFLAQLSKEYAIQLAQIERDIYALAGEEFLINSPKQLQHILFEKLKLPPIRRTKTGFSTDEAVLEQLSVQHELPARVLAHRQLFKLKSTYVDALPPLVHPRTGRLHPTFHQTGAATGRLSSSHPNVQNIPIRTEAGIRIREAFIPAAGMELVSADYSQVELRILAHYSEDASLIEAFQRDEDIHRRTAAEVAGMRPEEVSAEQRARAKAINFGILYGSSAFGIANQLGIATAGAQVTIDAYFARYVGVRRFIDSTLSRAREEGCVRTLLGRRRFLPDLRSKNRTLRTAAERMAVNTVIQGTAADLIKKAMVDVEAALRGAGLAARMLLQVHDELVFEAPPAEIERLREIVVLHMERVWPLRVLLRVEVGRGPNWRRAH